MDTLAPESTRQNLRSQRLNLLTNEPHQRLESLVKSKEPFASRGNFARFVAAQYLFQHDLEPLYRNEALARLFPGLASRARDDAARADLADLGHPVPEGDQSVREADLSLAEALGWLFVSEGSKLGAAFLFKKAAALELDENFGARHLAEPGGGRCASTELPNEVPRRMRVADWLYRPSWFGGRRTMAAESSSCSRRALAALSGSAICWLRHS